MSWRYTADGISTINLSLANLYRGRLQHQAVPHLLAAPRALCSAGFDLDAKVDADDVETFKKLSPTQRRLMLQRLLADRFHLAVHIETKTLPVYDLVVASGGSKLKLAAPDPPPPSDANPSEPPPKPRGMMRMGLGTLELCGPLASVSVRRTAQLLRRSRRRD